MKMHVAIIGAGAAGLAAARHCTDPKYGFTCEIFEQTDSLGGTWIYTDKIDVDDNGLPIHTSMYKGLRTNLPKEVMHFPDFKFPEYERSYLDHEEVLQYIEAYAKQFSLQQYIQFHHQVSKVTPLESNRWSITVSNLLTLDEVTKDFDAVMVCNGHYSKPVIPDIPGRDSFNGKQLHSHEYRCSADYRGQTVLIIGAGPSGIDIAMHLARDASKVLLSHRHEKIPPEKITFPSNIEQITNIGRITEKGAALEDKSSISADSIIYCTGYKYHYPFLTEACHVKVEDNRVQPLYKHLLNIEKPTMCLVGIPFQICPFPIFDYQIRLFLNFLNGSIKLPTRESMIQDAENDMNAKLAKGFPKKHAHRMGIAFQEQYFADLAKIGQLTPMPSVVFKLYAAVTGKVQRHLKFKIIDDDHFIQLH